jgi:hypothetical protein
VIQVARVESENPEFSDCDTDVEILAVAEALLEEDDILGHLAFFDYEGEEYYIRINLEVCRKIDGGDSSGYYDELLSVEIPDDEDIDL